jgi:thiamine biosynthesis lipoprotein
LTARRIVAALSFAALVLWLGLRPTHRHAAAESDPLLLRREFLAMGTQVSVTIHLAASKDRTAAAQAAAAVENFFHDFDHDWNPWGDGALATFNRALTGGTGTSVAIAPSLQPLFARAWQIHELGDGLFEPRIGTLVRLWGFDDTTRLPAAPPDRSAIEAALAALQAAAPYDDSGRYAASGVTWDFGAIAKGAAVDEALSHLRAAGFADAIVDAGGNLAARGRRGERPWRIAIRHPRADAGRRFLATLDVGDEAVNTHGDYERYFEYQGRRYCHILDPRSGEPAQGFQSLTVVHADAALADAGGAALFVAGPAHWRELARRLGLEQVVAVDAQGHVVATAALAKRLQWTPGVNAEVVP